MKTILSHFISKFLFITLLSTINSTTSTASTTKNTVTTTTEKVIELTSDTLQPFLKEKKMGFIKFYSPDCPHCDSIKSVYEESATVAKKDFEDVIFSKLDGDKFPELMEKYKIQDVPTILWFNNLRNQVLPYMGEMEAPSYFIEHIKTQLSFNTTDVDLESWRNITASKLFNETNNVLLYIGSPTENFDKFTSVTNSAYTIGMRDIYTSLDPKLLAYYKIDRSESVKSTVLVFKVNLTTNLTNFDKFSRIDFTEEDFKGTERNADNFLLHTRNSKIENILMIYSKNIVNIFNQNNERMIVLAIPTLTVVHDYSTDSTEYKNMLLAIKEVSEKYHKEIFFMVGSPRTKFTQIFVETFRILPGSITNPVICLTSAGAKDKNWVEKYKRALNDNDTKSKQGMADSLSKFISDWKTENIKPYISSEDTPEKPLDENGIYRLVGNTFKSVINSTTGKDIFLVLCSNKLETCKKFREIYSRVSRKLMKNKNIAFFEANPNENELDFSAYETIPGIIMMPYKKGGDKFTDYEEYKGRLTTREIIKFIKEKAVNKIESVETLEGEEDMFKLEEVNELKPINLDKRETVMEIHEQLTDKSIKGLYSTADEKIIMKESEKMKEVLDDYSIGSDYISDMMKTKSEDVKSEDMSKGKDKVKGEEIEEL